MRTTQMKMKIWFLVCLISIATPQQDSCMMQCVSMKSSKCEICYDQCKMQKSETNVFKSCKQSKCKYQNDINCDILLYESLSEKNCLQVCCYDIETPKFTNQTFEKCFQKNLQNILKQIQQRENSPINVFFHTLGYLMFLAMFCLFFSPCIGSILNRFKQAWKKFKQSKQQLEVEIVSQSCDKETVNKMEWKPFVQISDNQISQIPTTTNFKLIHGASVCFICQLTEINCQTSCGHQFHILCLQKSINKKLICPQCKSSDMNPLRVFCEACNQKESSFKIKMQSESLQKMLNFCKINCYQCRKTIEASGTGQL